MDRTLTSATAYYDETDPHNVGWAYRMAYSDGHQESGSLDSECDEDVRGDLGVVIMAHGGPDDAIVTEDDDGSGAYSWCSDAE